jgi:tight adherence protein C
MINVSVAAIDMSGIQSVGFVAFLFAIAAFLVVYAMMAPVNEYRQEDFSNESWGEVRAGASAADSGIFDRFVRPAVRNFLPQTPMAALVKARNNSKVQELLVRSGNPWNIQPEEFFGVQFVSGAAGFAAALLLVWMEILPAAVPFAAWLAVGAVGGAFLPKVLLDKERGKRRKQAQRGLPEALDLIVITLNSGMNFTPALAEVVKRLPEGLVKDELGRVSLDLRAGRTLERALLDFARRAPSDEVESFCKSVVQAERLGADVAETLTDQAETARQSYEALLDEKIGKLPTTLFFPILGLMLPALFIMILAPAFSSINGAL